jgi:hypothetical protein
MPNESESPSQPPPPRRSLRRLLAILLLVLLAPIVAWFVWGRIEAARLDRVLDALEVSGDPLDIEEFALEPATPEQHEASHLYGQAVRLVGGEVRVRLDGVAKAIKELCEFPQAGAGRKEQVATLQAFEDPYNTALALLDRASRLDSAGWDDADRPKRSSMEEVRPRDLGMVNAVRIARLACTGNGDPAAAALLSTLRLRRVLAASYPRLIPSQTAHSLQSLLTFTSPDPELLQSIQQEYEYETATDGRALEKQMVYSRAFWLYVSMPGVFSDSPAGFEGRRITPFEGIARMVTRPLRDRRMLAELREFDEVIQVAKQPWPARLDAAAALAKRHPNTSSSRRRGLVEVFTNPFGSHAATASLTRTIARDAEALASARASAGALAVARYQYAHNGTLPPTLHVLIPQYVSAPLIDPYSGMDLKYVRDGATYKVYSVGINRQDDGGRWEQNPDLQLSRRGNPPDIGIAVGVRPAAARD